MQLSATLVAICSIPCNPTAFPNYLDPPALLLLYLLQIAGQHVLRPPLSAANFCLPFLLQIVMFTFCRLPCQHAALSFASLLFEVPAPPAADPHLLWPSLL